MNNENLKSTSTMKAVKVAIWLIAAVAIALTFVFAALDRPLIGVLACACAILPVAVLSVILTKKSGFQYLPDTAQRRYRVGVLVSQISALMTAAGLLSLFFDVGVLPQLLLVLGIGGFSGASSVSCQAKQELTERGPTGSAANE